MNDKSKYIEERRRLASLPGYGIFDLSPIRVSDLAGRGPFDGPFLAKHELVDKEFIILEARKVKSSYPDDSGFYHCQCVDVDTDEPFHTSLGGVQVVEVIEQWKGEAADRPLRVKLIKSIAGSGLGYYELV